MELRTQLTAQWAYYLTNGCSISKSYLYIITQKQLVKLPCELRKTTLFQGVAHLPLVFWTSSHEPSAYIGPR